MGFVRSPIFYMGNKYEILDQLISLFPSHIKTFYDLFGGSGCVSGNAQADKIVYNELNDNIANLFKVFMEHTADDINNYILECIKKYDLNTEGTDVRQNVPSIRDIREFYNYNYLKFRDDYNKSERDYLMLFTLTFWSFCNLIRFNSDSEFNMPYGNGCYRESVHKRQIEDWCNLIKNKDIEVRQEDAFNILCDEKFDKQDFIYLDPPYSNTTAIYNEQRAFGGWTIEDDMRLFSILETLNNQGIRWGMSNVFKNKEFTNDHLIKWCEDNNWNVYYLTKNYVSLGKGNANSEEVYICNYTPDKFISLF